MLFYFVVQIVGSLITLVVLFLYALFPLNNPLFMGKTRCSRLISQAFRSSSCLSFAAVDCLITEDHQQCYLQCYPFLEHISANKQRGFIWLNINKSKVICVKIKLIRCAQQCILISHHMEHSSLQPLLIYCQLLNQMSET